MTHGERLTQINLNLPTTECNHMAICNLDSRLDRIYANKNIKILTSKIPFQYSDHEVLLTEFLLGARHRGPGYWKLNTSILSHANFQIAFKNFWTDWQK